MTTTRIRVLMTSQWRSFLASEAEHCSQGQLDRLCRVLDGAIRYEGYLRMILLRHTSILHGLKSLSTDHQRNLKQGAAEVVAEDSGVMARRTEFTLGLALETETFYLFASIYLDRIAQFLGRYFGQLRGVSTKSHDQLARNFRAFQEGHGLEVPSGFEQRLIDLKRRLKEFRDDQIALESEAKIQGIFAELDEGVNLAMAAAHQANRGTGIIEAESKGLGELAAAIDAHCEAVQSLVSATRARSQSLKIFPTADWPRSFID